jgi:hypothetical protein
VENSQAIEDKSAVTRRLSYRDALLSPMAVELQAREVHGVGCRDAAPKPTGEENGAVPQAAVATGGARSG